MGITQKLDSKRHGFTPLAKIELRNFPGYGEKLYQKHDVEDCYLILWNPVTVKGKDASALATPVPKDIADRYLDDRPNTLHWIHNQTTGGHRGLYQLARKYDLAAGTDWWHLRHGPRRMEKVSLGVLH